MCLEVYPRDADLVQLQPMGVQGLPSMRTWTLTFDTAGDPQ